MTTKLLTLSERHKQVARLLVNGHSQSSVAKLVGIHKSTISRLIRDPLLVQEMHRLQEIADQNVAQCVPGIPEKIQKGAHKSIEVLKDILEDKRTDPNITRVKANVALDILDRAGYGKVKQLKLEQSSQDAHLTSEIIEKIKQHAEKIKAKQQNQTPDN